MRTYNIIVTPEAEDDLRKYLKYLRDVKKNPQAVLSVMNDFVETKDQLSRVAGSIKEPENERLRYLGLKRINFIHHNYFLLYCIDGDNAFITNVFHGLEDFESKLR